MVATLFFGPHSMTLFLAWVPIPSLRWSKWRCMRWLCLWVYIYTLIAGCLRVDGEFFKVSLSQVTAELLKAEIQVFKITRSELQPHPSVLDCLCASHTHTQYTVVTPCTYIYLNEPQLNSLYKSEMPFKRHLTVFFIYFSSMFIMKSSFLASVNIPYLWGRE